VRTLFWLYLVVFVALSCFGVGDSFAAHHTSVALSIEVAGSVLSLIGMLLFWFDDRASKLRTPWRIVFIFLVAEFAVTNGMDYPKLLRDSKGHEWILVVSGIVLTAVMLPSFWMNARFAFGRQQSSQINGAV
jgi:hypothetical protein